MDADVGTDIDVDIQIYKASLKAYFRALLKGFGADLRQVRIRPYRNYMKLGVP